MCWNYAKPLNTRQHILDGAKREMLLLCLYLGFCFLYLIPFSLAFFTPIIFTALCILGSQQTLLY